MEKFFLSNIRAIHRGQIVSALGIVVYFLLCAVKAPEIAIAVVLVLFTLFALWVLLSVIAYPDRTEISYNITWGQGAVTIMLFAVMYLTLKSLLGAKRIEKDPPGAASRPLPGDSAESASSAFSRRPGWRKNRRLQASSQ